MEISFKELKELLVPQSEILTVEKVNELPFEIGQAYMFRTVTHIELGRVKSICGKFVELVEASWIPDTGRYHDFLKNGTPNEVEPYPKSTIVNTDSLINASTWDHDLPKGQK